MEVANECIKMKMKYRLGFVNEINAQHGIWYRFEILEIMRKYGMDTSKIEAINRTRWYPKEVFAALEAE